MTTKSYTTQLGAGLGMIDETRLLLELWQPGMGATDLYRTALDSGRFAGRSARRLHDLITVGFAQRFLVDAGAPAVLLKQLAASLQRAEFDQLLFLYTCRAQAILADFVREVYWPAYASGREVLSVEEAQSFVSAAIREGKTTIAWSPYMRRRAANNLTGCCADFGLLGRNVKSTREIQTYRLHARVAIILAYDLHFAGLGDNQITGHCDWALFGLDRFDVLDELKRLAARGPFIVQTLGEVTGISWAYKSMEELTHVIAQGGL